MEIMKLVANPSQIGVMITSLKMAKRPSYIHAKPPKKAVCMDIK
jgi:hypothetical protein